MIVNVCHVYIFMTYAFFMFCKFMYNSWKIKYVFCSAILKIQVMLDSLRLLCFLHMYVWLDYMHLFYIYGQNVVILGLKCKYCTNVKKNVLCYKFRINSIAFFGFFQLIPNTREYMSLVHSKHNDAHQRWTKNKFNTKTSIFIV